MKIIEVDEELYRYIASHTQRIGESASDILRRMLDFPAGNSEQFSNTIQKVDDFQAAQVQAMAKSQCETIAAEKALNLLLISDEFINQKTVVDRFIDVLSVLYQQNSTLFKSATETLQGRTRLYFSESKAALLEHGPQTKPKAIKETPFWVITNTNSKRKRSMLESIMCTMGLNDDLIEKIILAI